MGALTLAGILLWVLGVHSRRTAGTAPEPATVAVVSAKRKDLVQDAYLTAEFCPYQEIALHAKVSGYLKSIRVDVGDSVKEGEKIAELEIPELEDDLTKANAALLASQQDVDRALAEYKEAHLAYERLLGVNKSNPKLVAQQDLDNAKARDEAMKGVWGGAQQRVQERRSELEKIKTLLGYARITIPFDGVITKRFADPGALIQAGVSSNTQSMPLVELTQTNVLRLKFPVPESMVSLMRVGQPVEVHITSLDETLNGSVSRYTGKIDRSTRTMHTEVEVQNPEGRFKPGMFATVRLIMQEHQGALVVPIQALVHGKNASLFILGKNGIIQQRIVSVGLQTSDEAEIRSGLSEGEMVIVGNRNNIRAGQAAIGKEQALAPSI